MTMIDPYQRKFTPPVAANDASKVFHTVRRIDDHVDTIRNQMSYSIFWAESEGADPEFQKFLVSPQQVLRERVGIPENFRVETTLLGHNEMQEMRSACALMLVFPAQERVQMIIF